MGVDKSLPKPLNRDWGWWRGVINVRERVEHTGQGLARECDRSWGFGNLLWLLKMLAPPPP